MLQTIRAIANKALGRYSVSRPAPLLNPHKKELIDFACGSLYMRSFADLGAIWNVDGGYTFYAMERHRIEYAIIVDTDVSQAVRQRQPEHPGLRIIEGNFGDPHVFNQIGQVDGVFLFDILLHQVNPNWDEILRIYSSVAKVFLVFNQQFTNFTVTTRLVDLSRDEYFRSIPHTPDEEPYKTCFQNLDALHPKHRRPYRDVHNIWQWGITDADLIACLSDLGFKMQLYKNCGQVGQLRNVENHAFVFSKSRPGAP
jgi:hypothetical protein